MGGVRVRAQNRRHESPAQTQSWAGNARASSRVGGRGRWRRVPRAQPATPVPVRAAERGGAGPRRPPGRQEHHRRDARSRDPPRAGCVHVDEAGDRRTNRPRARRVGDCWMIDLAGAGVPDRFRELRWSPLQRADSYANARLMAGAEPVSANGRHWMNRAGGSAGVLSARRPPGGEPLRRVVSWILSESVEVAVRDARGVEGQLCGRRARAR